MKTLIAYASKHGCTEKCARLIADGLRSVESGQAGQVDMADLKHGKGTDISEYQVVIIGGPVYAGRMHKKVKGFLGSNIDKLLDKKVGLFICGMAEGEEIEKEINSNIPEKLLKAAAAVEFIGGEFILDKMGFVEKIIVKNIAKVTENKSGIKTDKIQNLINSLK